MKTPTETPPSNAVAAPRWISLIFGLSLLACVVLAVWSWQARQAVGGPAHMVEASDRSLWLVMADSIWKFDKDGKVLRQLHSQRDLKLVGHIGSLAPLPDGEIILNDEAAGTLHILSAEGRHLTRIDPAAHYGHPLGQNAYAVYDPRLDRIVISDTDRHRLLAFGRDGAARGQSPGSEDGLLYRHPGQLVINGEGFPWLVDTSNHRLVQIDADLKPMQEIEARDRRYLWPHAVGFDRDNGFWVGLNNDQGLGRVVNIGLDGIARNELPLPQGAIPKAIVSRDDDMLITDHGNFEIRRYTRFGQPQGHFGDERIDAALADAKARYLVLDSLMWAGVGLASLIVAAWLGSLLLQRLAASPRDFNGVSLPLPKPGGPGLPLAHAFRFLGYPLLLAPPLIAAPLLPTFFPDNDIHLLTAQATTLLMGFTALLVALPLRSDYWQRWRRGEWSPLWKMVAYRQLCTYHARIAALLHTGERIEGYAVYSASRWSMPALLVVTNRRLMLWPSSMQPRGVKILALETVAGATILKPQAPPWWQAWLPSFPLRCIILKAAGEYKAIEFYDPAAAYDLQRALHNYAMTRLRQSRMGIDTKAATDIPLPDKLRGNSPPAVRSALLSMLVPGLGQYFQERLGVALGFMLLCGGLLLGSIRPIITLISSHNDVDAVTRTMAWVVIPLLLILWISNIRDAYRFAQNERPA